MRLTTGTSTRIVVDLTFEFDPTGATVAVDIDNDEDWHAAEWLAPAVARGDGWFTRSAQTVQFFVAGPEDNPGTAVVLAPGRHFTTARVTMPDGGVFTAPSTIIDVVSESRFVSVDELRSYLSNAGGAGSRTAAELDDDRLAVKLEEATAEVVGRLSSAYAIADGITPPLVRTIVLGIAAYLSTLEYYGSQPLEDRDPVNLAYQRAQGLLERIATGKLTIEGVTPVGGGSTTGEAAIYQGGPAVGLAEPFAPYPGHGVSVPQYFGGVIWE
jgi:hypothetical protein